MRGFGGRESNGRDIIDTSDTDGWGNKGGKAKDFRKQGTLKNQEAREVEESRVKGGQKV